MCACKALLDHIRNVSCGVGDRHVNHQPFCVIMWVNMPQDVEEVLLIVHHLGTLYRTDSLSAERTSS